MILSAFLRFWTAWYSSLLMLLAGFFDFLRHFTTSARKLCAFVGVTLWHATSVFTMKSLIGISLGVTAKFNPFLSTDFSGSINTRSDLLNTHLFLSITFLSCCWFCNFSFFAVTNFVNLSCCFVLVFSNCLLRMRNRCWFTSCFIGSSVAMATSNRRASTQRWMKRSRWPRKLRLCFNQDSEKVSI